MFTSSCKKPWRKAFLTPSCLTSHFELTAVDGTTLIVVALTTRLNVSSKSNPSSCENSLATSLGLYLSIIPSTFYFVLNTHIEPTKFIQGYFGTKIHVLLEWKTSISSCIAASQWCNFSASLVVFGSLTIFVLPQEISDKCCSFALFLVIIWCPCGAGSTSIGTSTKVVDWSVALSSWWTTST